MRRVTRRAWLACGSAALAACGRRRGSGYDGFVFVANQQGRNVAAVDLMNFSVARRIGLATAPEAVIPHAARRAAYVLCPEDGAVHEIDTAKLGIRRTVRTGAPAAAMRLSPDGRALWLLSRQALVQIPLDGFRPAARIRLPGPGDEFDISRDGVAAVSFRRENRIGIADLRSSAMDTVLPAGGDPGPVGFRFDGRQFLAGNRAGRTVTIWDVRAARAIVNLPVPMEPANFCFNGDGGQLFVSGPGMDAVSIVYPYNTELAETILAGRGPESMAACPNPAYLFVANPQSGAVTVLDIDTRKLVAVAQVGGDPGRIVFTPDSQYALILNRGSGDLAVVRIASLRTWGFGAGSRYTSPPIFTLIPVGSGPVSAAVVPA